MGFSLSGKTTAAATTLAAQTLSTVVAGRAVAKNDAVLVGPTGKGQPVGVTNYAAVAAVGQITAQTQVTATRLYAGKNCGLRLDDGSIMIVGPLYGTNGIVAPNSDDTGCAIYRYAADGSFICSRSINDAAYKLFNPHLMQMSNGNVALVYGMYDNASGTITLHFTTMTPSLQLFLTGTVGSMYHPAITDLNKNSNYFGAVALPAGGFLVTYQDYANNALQKLAVYDDFGNVVTAATTVHTWTGVSGNVFTDAAVLSNGNVAIACYSAFSESIGTYHAIFGADGTQIKAFEQIIAASATNNAPEISVLAGYYAIGRINDNVESKVFIFSNAGIKQGDTFTTERAYNGTRMKLTNDGENFYLIGASISTSGNYAVSQIPTTGGAGAKTMDTGLSMSATFHFDVACDGALIMLMQSTITNGANQFAAIDTDTGRFVTPLTAFGVSPANNNGAGPAIIAVSDFAFVGVYDYAEGGVLFWVGKYAPSAIVGVAQTAATANGTVSVLTGPGVYQTNPNMGTAANFDHSGSAVAGNKGSIQQRSLTITGI